MFLRTIECINTLVTERFSHALLSGTRTLAQHVIVLKRLSMRSHLAHLASHSSLVVVHHEDFVANVLNE